MGRHIIVSRLRLSTWWEQWYLYIKDTTGCTYRKNFHWWLRRFNINTISRIQVLQNWGSKVEVFMLNIFGEMDSARVPAAERMVQNCAHDVQRNKWALICLSQAHTGDTLSIQLCNIMHCTVVAKSLASLAWYALSALYTAMQQPLTELPENVDNLENTGKRNNLIFYCIPERDDKKEIGLRADVIKGIFESKMNLKFACWTYSPTMAKARKQNSTCHSLYF